MVELDVGTGLLAPIGLVAAVVAGCAGSPAQPPAGQPAASIAAPPNASVSGPSSSTAGAPPGAHAARAGEVDDRVAPSLDARESAVLAELAAADARALERFRQRLGVGGAAGRGTSRIAEGSGSALGTGTGTAAAGPRPVVRAAIGSGAPAGAEAFVARRNGRLRRCHATARGSDPTTGTGDVHVELARDAGGALRVAARRGSGGPLSDALLACVEEVMRAPVDRDPAGPWAFAATITFDLE